MGLHPKLISTPGYRVVLGHGITGIVVQGDREDGGTVRGGAFWNTSCRQVTQRFFTQALLVESLALRGGARFTPNIDLLFDSDTYMYAHSSSCCAMLWNSLVGNNS
jgi:hypothetical protein